MNPDDLPVEIVQPLLQLGRALMAHARAHRAINLAAHEDGVEDAGRVVAPTLLEGVLQLATRGLEDDVRPIAARCPGCQQRRWVQSRRGRQVQTRLGPIRLQRWWHHCWTCAHGWGPPDHALSLAPFQQTSTGPARWQAALGGVTTFREAPKIAAELTGVAVMAADLDGARRTVFGRVDEDRVDGVDGVLSTCKAAAGALLEDRAVICAQSTCVGQSSFAT